MLPKPPTCAGCPLEVRGRGYVPPSGPPSAAVLLVGEAAGADEVNAAVPFVGAAGAMLNRLLGLVGWDRAQVRIDNVVRCQPPNNWLDGAPWEAGAIAHCTAAHLATTLREPHTVIVPLGNSALRHVLGLRKQKASGVGNFHGTLTPLSSGQIVVPTYHPSFLQRGASNLIGTVLWDLRQAEAARDHGRPVDPASLVIDPPLEWFRAWVDQVVAARTQDPGAYPISSDVETPDKAGGKDEGEITADDQSYQILRQNVSCHPDEGVTVPQVGPFLDELQRLYASPGPIWEWNKEYDFPRQVVAGQLIEADNARVIDLMWLWHYLQSDLPRGLGFAAPFYSTYGPWKHLADADPPKYGAIDGLQTHRVGFGVVADLIKLGMYAGALRHVHQLHHLALRPAQLVGIQIDRARLLRFKADLTTKAAIRLTTLGEVYPQVLLPLTPKQGLTKRPLDNVLHVKATAFTRKGTPRAGKPTSELKQALYAKARVVEKIVLKEVLCCQACGAVEVQKRHRCAPIDGGGTAGGPGPPNAGPAGDGAGGGDQLSLTVASLTRYFWQEPFNPDSPDQVLAYLQYRKHAPGKAKKTHLPTTNRETLDRLERRTGDPFYRALLDYRAIAKVQGTYVEGTERRLDHEDRLHPVPTFRPSTMRLSYQNPNIQNVVADKDGAVTLAAGFRRCVVAAPGCRLLEVDYRGIEAVEVGWLSRDPAYIRLARRGVHAGLASHLLGKPYDPTADDATLTAYLAAIKVEAEAANVRGVSGSGSMSVYDAAKRYVHGRSYGLTVQGMVLQFPDLFPTLKDAERYARIFEAMAPAVPKWQAQTQQRAARDHYLGGPGGHPFGYRHWYWSIFTYQRLTTTQYYRLIAKAKQAGVEPPVAIINGLYFRVGLGEDSKRALAFEPSSIAAGVLKEAMLALFDPTQPNYIGDCYFGKTPLRAPIHDSLLLEVPLQAWDRVVPTVCRVMQTPILQQPCPPEWRLGASLTIGVAAKGGQNWAPAVGEADARARGVEANPDGMRTIRIAEEIGAGEGYWTPAEVEDAEEGADLAREVG